MKARLSIWKTSRSPFTTPAANSEYLAALVTLAVVAWFSLALAVLGGEWHGAPAAQSTPPAAAESAPALSPQVSGLASIRLI
jgi:hypothetical protein